MKNENREKHHGKQHRNTSIIFMTAVLAILLMTCIPAVLADVPVDPNGEDPPSPNDPDGPTIEVVFLLDSTGSMNDEILSVKSHIRNIVEEAMSGTPRPLVRVGIVTYRDHPPEDGNYVYRKIELNDDIEAVMDSLHDIEASGGGDGPEAVADGLFVAVNGMGWSDDARKLIFLIGDAPPHGLENNDDASFLQGCPDGRDYLEDTHRAADSGITIHAVGCSGIEDYAHGVDVFKEIARQTDGEYERLKYRRVIAEEYYEAEEVATEYALPGLDYTYDEDSGTILVSNLNRFTELAVKSAAMEAGVTYTDPDESTPDTSHPDNGSSTSENTAKTIPDLAGLSAVLTIAAVTIALLVSRRY